MFYLKNREYAKLEPWKVLKKPRKSVMENHKKYNTYGLEGKMEISKRVGRCKIGRRW